ncbi:MAG: VWA domain-containing protein [Acidobacteria bacterium]|nr:VWA domain-containing protein [Acidobacteriota bacterium]
MLQFQVQQRAGDSTKKYTSHILQHWMKPAARSLVALALAAILAAGSTAQQPSSQQPNPMKPPQGPPTAVSPAASQPAASQDDPRGRIRSRVDMVVVPVTVKDSTGRVVLDLAKEDFRLLEDKVEQRIELFSAEPFPLSAVILLDNSLSKKAADQVQKTISSLAAGMSADDEAAIMLFDSIPSEPTEFFADNDKLYEQLKRVQVNGEFTVRAGGPMTSGPRINSMPTQGSAPVNSASTSRLPKHLDDAVFAAAQLLRKAPRDRRRIIFLISDGQNEKNNTYKFEDVSRALLSSGISVFSIGVGDVRLDRGPHIPLVSLENLLARYAYATGGDVFYAGSKESLSSLYARVTEQARLQYTLGYASKGTDRTKDFHDIDVRVKRPGLNVLARQGYYSPSP